MAAVWSMDQVTVPTLHCSQPMGNILRPSERRVLESNSSSVVLSTFLIFFCFSSVFATIFKEDHEESSLQQAADSCPYCQGQFLI